MYVDSKDSSTTSSGFSLSSIANGQERSAGVNMVMQRDKYFSNKRAFPANFTHIHNSVGHK